MKQREESQTKRKIKMRNKKESEINENKPMERENE